MFSCGAHADELIVGPADSLTEYAGESWYISERSVGDYIILNVDGELVDESISVLSSSYEVVDGRHVSKPASTPSSMGVYGTIRQASVDDFDDPLSDRQESFSWAHHDIFNAMSALKEVKDQPVVMVLGDGSTAHSDVKTVGGYNFFDDSEDYSSSGSDCRMTKGLGLSSIIGATNNNQTGIAGIAGNAELYMSKVESADCDAGVYEQSPAAVYDALVSVASDDGDTGAPIPDVVLVTQAFEGPCPTSFQEAIDDLVDGNAVVVASSGDDDTLVGNYYPSNCQNVITVAAVDEDGYPESYSNLTAHVDVTAPGDSFVAGADDDWDYVNSTDYAAATVAGVVALIKTNYPDLTVSQVTSALTESVYPYSDAGECSTGDTCGYGYMNAEQMLDYVNSVYDPEFELTHAFTGDSCLIEREVEALSAHMDVCAAFKTNISMSYADDTEPQSYLFKLIKRPAGGLVWYNNVNPVTGEYSSGRENGIEVIETYDSTEDMANAVTLPLIDVDASESEYAIASCISSYGDSDGQWNADGKLIDGDLCFGVTELDSESVTLPDYCE